jgi:hypothetical protein
MKSYTIFSGIIFLGVLVSPTTFAYDNYSARYEKSVDLPKCNARDPNVRIISKNSDWSDINNSKYQVFCVEPGDYSAVGEITLTASGTQKNKRYLRHIDSGTKEGHPWRQKNAKRAILNRIEVKADYWVVDGLTVTDPKGTSEGALFDVKKSSDNIFNHLLLEHNDGTLYRVTDGSKKNTLQNSVLRYTKVENRQENACVYIAANDPYGDTVDAHIVNNEIYDCAGDAIQVNHRNRSKPKRGVIGMVLENNDMYITPNMYVDCKTGKKTSKGKCACAENAVDVKILRVNSTLSDSTLSKIIHNRMWGYQSTTNLPKEKGGLCEKTNDHYAFALVFHYQYADFALVEDNLIFDSENGIWLAKSGPDHISIIGNLLYDVANKTNPYAALSLNNGSKIEAYHNAVIDSDVYLRTGKSARDINIEDNLFIDAGTANFKRNDYTSNSIVGNNYFFNTAPYTGNADIGKNYVASDKSAAQTTDFCFRRKRLTENEKSCIGGIKSTKNSPHMKLDGAAGKIKGIGVDDKVRLRSDFWGNPIKPMGLNVVFNG